MKKTDWQHAQIAWSSILGCRTDKARMASLGGGIPVLFLGVPTGQGRDQVIDQLTDLKMCRHLMSDQSWQEIQSTSVILCNISSAFIDAVHFDIRYASNSNSIQKIVLHVNFMWKAHSHSINKFDVKKRKRNEKFFWTQFS